MYKLASEKRGNAHERFLVDDFRLGQFIININEIKNK